MSDIDARETPTLFSAPMVRAIRAGTKTQTRRVMKPQPNDGWEFERPPVFGRITSPHPKRNKFGAFVKRGVGTDFPEIDLIPCPYGMPGDRIRVKETFVAWGRWETRFSAKKGRDEWHFIDMTLECGKQYRYTADAVGDNGPRQRGSTTPQWWKRPAIFMPRIASRILLEVVSVRVERLHDISEADALAEGINCYPFRPDDGFPLCNGYTHLPNDGMCSLWPTAKEAYCSLWEDLNGNTPAQWSANPWVWAVEFKRIN